MAGSGAAGQFSFVAVGANHLLQAAVQLVPNAPVSTRLPNPTQLTYPTYLIKCTCFAALYLLHLLLKRAGLVSS